MMRVLDLDNVAWTVESNRRVDERPSGDRGSNGRVRWRTRSQWKNELDGCEIEELGKQSTSDWN